MLTFFTTCKPFEGRNAVLQRNAIESWVRLGHGCDVILVGDDAGTAEIAAAFGLRHVPNVRRNEYGTPLLDSLFAEAEAVARHDLLCYLNADIMLMGDFLDAAACLEPERLLMISRRWNVDIKGAWNFDDPDWERKLHELTLERGFQKSALGGPDFFVFRRGQWGNIPPFALGRTRFDNWLIYAACTKGFPVIDASACVMAVHQNHDCGHADGGWAGAWHGVEAQRNQALARNGADTYNFLDATHLMTPEGPQPAMSPEHLARRYERRRAQWFDRRLFLAATLHELGRNEEALAVVKEAARACTNPASVRRYARAVLRILFAMGRRERAEDFIHKLLAAEPAPIMAYHLASICEELGAYETASRLFRAVLAHDGHNAATLKAGASYHLARTAVEIEDLETATRYAEACLAENPTHEAARALLERLQHPSDTTDRRGEITPKVPGAPLQPADARD